ncbi:MAG: LamG domain-containing protein [Candidatus Nanopelagicales bacterium]
MGATSLTLSAALTASMFAPTAAAVSLPNPVALWHLDSFAGDTTADASGNGHTGYVDNMGLVAGKFGNAVTHNSADSGRILVHPGGLTSDTVTVSAWVRGDGTLPGTTEYIVAQGAHDCTAAEWGLYTGSGRSARFYVYNDGGITFSQTAPTSVWDGDWHIVTGTYDGANVRLYLDGAQVQGSPGSTDLGIAAAPNRDVSIGNYPTNSCNFNSQSDAAIDEVHVYDTALSADQVAELYSPAPAHSPTSSPTPTTAPTDQPAAIQASFTALSRSGVTLLRASGTASRYEWDLNADQVPDLQCPAGSPVLGVNLGKATTASVNLTEFSASGQSRFTQSVQFARAGPAPPKKVRKRIGQSAFCGGDDLTTGLQLPPRACRGAVIVGVIEAQGCLQRVSSTKDLPRGERVLTDQLIAEFQRNPQIVKWIQSVCRAGDPSPGCYRERSTDWRNAAVSATEVYYATNPVNINGMTFRPGKGAAVVISPYLGRIISTDTSVDIGPLPLKIPKRLNLDVRGNTHPLASPLQSGRAGIAGFSLGDVPLGPAKRAFGGFLPKGNVSLDFQQEAGRRFTQLDLHLALPAQFSMAGLEATGDTRVRADNENGLYVDNITVRADRLNLGAVEISDLTFVYNKRGKPDYNCDADWWKATARIYLGSEKGKNAGILMAPDPGPDANGIAFCGRQFRSAGAIVQFGNPIPQPQLFPGVFLDNIGFSVRLEPTVISGTAGLDVVKVAQVQGTMVVALASESQPYTLSANDAGEPLRGLSGHTFRSATIMSGGSYALQVPGTRVTIPIGSGYVAYSYPARAMVGGAARMNLGWIDLAGSVDGDVNVERLLFSIHGKVTADIEGLPQAGAEAWVTSKGVVACLNLWGVHPGAGYKWGGSAEIFWGSPGDGCKPSSYWVDVSAGSGGAQLSATGGIDFRVKRGEKKMIRLLGDSGAPIITVTDPDGARVETTAQAGDGPVKIIRMPDQKRTFVLVVNGKPGRYSIGLTTDSPGVRDAAESQPVTPLRVRGKVVGKGLRRTLKYRVVGGPPKQRITLFEQSAGVYRRLGKAGKSGTVRFAPSGSGRHRIVAEVAYDGVPAAPITVTRFSFKAPKHLPAPKTMRLHRAPKKLRIAWRRVPGADSYEVAISGRSGMSRLKTVKHPRAVVKVPKSLAGRVAIRAVRGPGDKGRVARARFRARAKVKSDFRPFRELRRS